MGFLIANFATSADKPKDVYSVSLDEVKSIHQEKDGQVCIAFKDDVTGHNDYQVFMYGDVEDISKAFAEAQHKGHGIDAQDVSLASKLKPSKEENYYMTLG